MDETTYDCIEYDISIFHLIIPPSHILYKLCLSTDKTKLVLISIIRFIILLYLFNYLRSKKIITWDMNRTITTLFFYLFAGYLIINILYILISLFKYVVIGQDELNNIVTGLAQTLQSSKVTRPAVMSESSETVN